MFSFYNKKKRKTCTTITFIRTLSLCQSTEHFQSTWVHGASECTEILLSRFSVVVPCDSTYKSVIAWCHHFCLCFVVWRRMYGWINCCSALIHVNYMFRKKVPRHLMPRVALPFNTIYNFILEKCRAKELYWLMLHPERNRPSVQI